MSEDMIFCRACGTKNEPLSTDIITAQDSPARHPSANADHKPKGTKSGKGFIFVLALFGIIILGLGIFLFLKTGELNKTRKSISELEQNVTTLDANVIRLEGLLAAEQAFVANLNTQLANEKGLVEALQNELAQAKNSLSSAQGNIAALEAALSTAKSRVNTLEAEMAEAEASLTSLQDELAAAQHTNSLLATDLETIRSPRHFNSINELSLWLYQDDTNTNPAFANLSTLEKAYVLQVKALRDGYIVSVVVGWDLQQNVVSTNSAIAGGMLCLINISNGDPILIGPAVTVAVTPLP